MPISAVDTISLAFQHTKQQLFGQFRLGQWSRLALVGLLAGELGSGGGLRNQFNLPHQPGSGPSFPSIDPALIAAVITALVVVGFVLGIIFLYISSVMRFILFDSVVTRECHIRDGWSRRQSPGLQFFLWKLVYTLAMIVGAVVLIGIPVGFAFAMGWMRNPKQHLLPLILGGILLVFVFLFCAIAAAVIFVLTKDFVVPQMALEGISAFEGWRRLWPMLQGEKGEYAVYIVMKIVLAIVAGILVGIATLIMGLFFAIPTVGLALVAVLSGKSAGLTWNPYTITIAVVVGLILLAIFLYFVSLLSVPVIVFFPAYSIYFFASRYPALSRVMYPAAPVLNPVPPPLPPTPQPI